MINDQLSELYAQYYSQRYNEDYKKKMIMCGVVDEEAYLRSTPRIVFVLKEPHTDKVGFSIPERLNDNINRGTNGFEKAWGYTWNQAGIWAYAVHNGFKNYEELRKPAVIAEGVRTIGMTNLKKTGGGPVEIQRKIRSEARREVELWRRELEIMDPELIICGRTYKNVTSNLGTECNNRLPDIHGRTYHYSLWEINGHKTVILEFSHPANRKNRDETLELLRQLMKSLEDAGLIRKSDTNFESNAC
jgi:hypothetical protein